MKKVFLLATAAFLVTGLAFAHEGGKKGGKDCCKGSKECKKDEKKDTKETKATKTTAKVATSKA
jgi:hypothetical protein